MLLMEMMRTALTPEKLAAFDSFIDGLPDGYQAVVRSGLSQQARILGAQLEPNDHIPRPLERVYGVVHERIVRGEIVTNGQSLCLLQVDEILRNEPGTRVNVSDADGDTQPQYQLRLTFLTGTTDRKPLEDFATLVNKELSADLRKFILGSQRFEDLKNEGGQPPTAPTHSELSLASELIDKSVRTLAVAMKAVGGLLVSDLGNQLPGRSQGEVERAKNSLLQTGLAVSEVVVICRKSQAQIACVPGRETLEDVSRLSVICACGRAYLDERIEEALNVIDATRALLDSSRWLSLIVLDELLRLGITLDQIRIDQVRGGDELDAFVNVSGELVLFEFKDKRLSHVTVVSDLIA